MENDIVKITGALYKLLEALPDQDPLKNKTKEKALAVLEGDLGGIAVLEKYLDVAAGQGWISAINVLILKKEYAGLKGKKIPMNTSYTDRQSKILKILENKEKAQVSDLIKQLPNITKRTVRRDLDELLKMKIITRIGEFNQVFYQKVDRTS